MLIILEAVDCSFQSTYQRQVASGQDLRLLASMSSRAPRAPTSCAALESQSAEVEANRALTNVSTNQPEEIILAAAVNSPYVVDQAVNNNPQHYVSCRAAHPIRTLRVCLAPPGYLSGWLQWNTGRKRT